MSKKSRIFLKKGNPHIIKKLKEGKVGGERRKERKLREWS